MWFGLFELPVALAWLAISAVALIVMFSVEAERTSTATGSLILLLVFLHLGHFLNAWALFHSPVLLFVSVLAYLLLGAFYSFVKWGSFLGKWKSQGVEEIESTRATFLVSKSQPVGDTIPEEFKKAWADFLRHSGIKKYMEPIKVRKHIGKLISWAAYWPFSAVYTLIDDPIRKLFQWFVIRVCGRYLQMLANRTAASMVNEIGVTPDDIVNAEAAFAARDKQKAAECARVGEEKARIL
jgi:uncharacterized membrane protein